MEIPIVIVIVRSKFCAIDVKIHKLRIFGICLGSDDAVGIDNALIVAFVCIIVAFPSIGYATLFFAVEYDITFLIA